MFVNGGHLAALTDKDPLYNNFLSLCFFLMHTFRCYQTVCSKLISNFDELKISGASHVSR
ncbi:hypothetical protein CHS0354_006706, partial [Potamilus streckersoni]